eukprot:436050_1
MSSIATNWNLLTIAMGICFSTCLFLILLQIKAFRWYSIWMNDNKIYTKKRELFCLYGVYVLASLCSLQCLLNHISNYFPKWYCEYGMSICVILHEASKTFSYGFFLERAKSVISATKSEILPPMILKYVLPIYISSYFALYSVICPWTFRGLATNPNNKQSTVPTACLFDEYESWVFYVSVGVEVFNSAFFVFLFAYPLCKIIKENRNKKVIQMIKYNIIFSSIACISSVIFLLYRALSRTRQELAGYLWLAGNIDLIINAICTFLMVTANRKYLSHKRHIVRNSHETNNNLEIDKSNISIKSIKQPKQSKINNNIEHESLIQMGSLINSTNWNENVENIENNENNDDHRNLRSDGTKADMTLTYGKNTNISKNDATMDSTPVDFPKLQMSCTPFNQSNTIEDMKKFKYV